MPICGPATFAERRRRAAVGIAVVMVVWFHAVSFLAVAAFFTGFTLPGAHPPSEEQQAKTGSLVLALVAVLVLLPAAAMVVGVRFQRPVAASFCGLITVLGLAVGVFLVPLGLEAVGWRSTPAVTHVPQPSNCVERSGGDTRCPGG
jgi:hypothetical protein